MPREVDVAVGKLIAAEIEDGDCLQIGIGAMPNAVCATLLESGARDLGVHTEMMTDGLADLCEAGRITGAENAGRGQERLRSRSARDASIPCSTGTGTCTAPRSTTPTRPT